MKTAYYTIAIMCIAVQSFHAWYAIDTFNHLPERWMRRVQSASFCGIIGVGIMLFVISGFTYLALAGAVIETVLNIYYYQNLDVDGRSTKSKKKQWLKWWVLCWLFPGLIYVFSHLAHTAI